MPRASAREHALVADDRRGKRKGEGDRKDSYRNFAALREDE